MDDKGLDEDDEDKTSRRKDVVKSRLAQQMMQRVTRFPDFFEIFSSQDI